MEKIKISNFRKIKDEWNVELNPVTFLTGRNNSGKSTIIKSILLLKDYFDSDNFFRLNFNGPNIKNHKITSFSNAINYFNKQKIRHDNILKFEFQNEKHSILLEFFEGKNGYGNLKKIEIEDKYGHVFGIYSNLYYSHDVNKLNDVISVKNLPKNSTREKKYFIKIPDLTFNPSVQQLEANRLLKKILNNTKRIEPLFIWFFRDQDVKDIAHRCIGRLLKEKEKEINKDGNNSLKRFNSLKSEGHVLEKEKNITNKKDYFDEIKINIDNDIYLLTNKWDEESRIDLYILMDSYHYLPSVDDIFHFHQKNSIVKPIKLLEEDSKIIEYSDLLLEISKYDPALNSSVNQFTIISEKFEIKNNFKYGGEKFFFKEYLEELIFDKSDKIRQQNNNVRQKNNRIGSYFRNLRLLTAYIDRAKKINLSYLSPFKYHQKNFYSLHHDENEAQLALINNSIMLSKDKEDGDTYKKFVTEWIQKFEVGDSYEFQDINFKKTKEKLGVQIFISDVNSNFVNLKDKGLGSGQIFFMILNIANLIFSKSDLEYRKMRSPKLLLIEEPECNLHPALQSRLADLFYAITTDVASNYSKDPVHLLIETHSEYIIRKSQNIVKTHHSAKDIFKTYYIKDDGKKDDKPESLEYNENGTFKNKFGTGFFDEARNLKLDLF